MSSVHLKASPITEADYFRLLINRRAYTLQSNKPHGESGQHYYYRPTNKKAREGLGLTLDTIRRHLEGEITFGLYAINPTTQCSKWVAIDADYPDALADLARIRSQLRHDGVDSALENSRRGGHLWFLLAEPLPARDCRVYVHSVALSLGIPIKQGKQREGIEVFPKQDFLRPGRYGNAIRGPLGIHRGAAQRFWFEGADEDLASQMRYLNSLPKLTGEQLARLIAGKAILLQLLAPEPKPKLVVRPHKGGPEFRILDHISTKLRSVGQNNVTRCPSCAEEGHDRSGDNLSISIEDPRKYICWAGCTSDMIRSALGCPRAVPHHLQNKEASNVEIWPDSNGLTGGEIPRRGTQSDGLRG